MEAHLTNKSSLILTSTSKAWENGLSPPTCRFSSLFVLTLLSVPCRLNQGLLTNAKLLLNADQNTKPSAPTVFDFNIED